MAHTRIAPQPGPPGVIGSQHGLQRLTETFAALETGQRQHATRDLAIRTQRTSQATALAQLGRGLRWQRDGRPRSWDRPLYAFRGGLSGAGASSTNSSIVANIERGF